VPMTTVTLLIFSGRPNPTWELAAEEVIELIPKLLDAVSAEEPSILGYGGFLVESNDPGMPAKMIVRDDAELERFMLRTGRRYLSPEIIRTVEQAIK
jgi:hypothetical protein